MQIAMQRSWIRMGRLKLHPVSAVRSGFRLPSKSFLSNPYLHRNLAILTPYSIMKGYWRRPDADAETFVTDSFGRWMRTGDIAYVSESGHFFIVDRMKELIKVKGNQVAPAELEALLLEHPGLTDAAVVGVTIGGEELPRAYVVRREGASVSEGEVAAWLEAKVSRYKRLAGGVVFVDGIPKNPVSFDLSTS